MNLQGRLNNRQESGDKLYVYFDWKKDSEVSICAAVYEREGSAVELEKLMEEYEDVGGENNYHHTLRGFILALKLIEKLGIKYSKHKVVFLNQNELVFKWISEGCLKAEYEDLLLRADDLMLGLNYEEFSFKKCEGKANRAKKLLSFKRPSSRVNERELNLSDRLKTPRKLKVITNGK